LRSAADAFGAAANAGTGANREAGVFCGRGHYPLARWTGYCPVYYGDKIVKPLLVGIAWGWMVEDTRAIPVFWGSRMCEPAPFLPAFPWEVMYPWMAGNGEDDQGLFVGRRADADPQGRCIHSYDDPGHCAESMR